MSQFNDNFEFPPPGTVLRGDQLKQVLEHCINDPKLTETILHGEGYTDETIQSLLNSWGFLSHPMFKNIYQRENKIYYTFMADYQNQTPELRARLTMHSPGFQLQSITDVAPHHLYIILQKL